MLIRVVRMTFHEERLEEFMEIFEASKHRIRGFKGCSHLELMKDYNDPCVLSTYSIWEDESALNAYRDSELFAGVWAKTKALFSAKPAAFSLRKFIEVPG